MEKKICVVGIDEFNIKKLHSFNDNQKYEYHPILKVSELQGRDTYPMEELFNKAISNIEELNLKPDAIIGFWNFPVTCLTPLIAREYNLPHLPLDALIKCVHKYLSRIEQEKVIPDNTPDFSLVDPFGDQPLESVDLDFPFWLKPVVSFASQLGFKINSKEEFDESLAIIKDNIHRLADPANYVMEQIDLPDAINDIDGYYCVAEEIIKGEQCTIEGYVYEGEIGFTGVFDSKRFPGRETFYSYEYPTELSGKVIQRIEDLSRKVLNKIGYDNSSFNIEYFYDKEEDHLWLLEINPRISQSHAEPFHKVDGAPNHEPMVDVALGQKPNFPTREGDYDVSGKFYYRHFENGLVKEIPGEENLAKIRDEIPDMKIKLWVEEGTKLSDLHDQDSYSYKLASVYLGAENRDELYKKRDRCFDQLNFKIEPISSE